MIDVLVVDDDFRVAALHAEAVALVTGFRVVGQVHTAAATLQAVARHHPQLVLPDVYLPDASGLEVLRRLGAAPEPRPDVIIVSAARDLASLRSAMRGGAVQYLVKPVELSVLQERLTTYRELAERREGERDVDQREIDALFAVMGRGGAGLPPGASTPTAERIVEELQGPGDLSAQEVAARVGISRATAQRYLTALQRGGVVELSLRYGATGRPEHRYRRG